MANETQVSITGYVATEPASKALEDGRTMTSLRVASTPRRFSRKTGEWADGPTSFVTVACWRKLAENVAISLRKGEPVVVIGTMTVRRYDARDGSPRTDVEVDATSIGHDLSRGVARFQRTRGPAGGSAAGMTAADAPPDPLDGDAGLRDGNGGPGDGDAGLRDGNARDGDAGPRGEADGGTDDVLDDRAVAALLGGDTAQAEEAPVAL